jgi:hypothetical protein
MRNGVGNGRNGRNGVGVQASCVLAHVQIGMLTADSPQYEQEAFLGALYDEQGEPRPYHPAWDRVLDVHKFTSLNSKAFTGEHSASPTRHKDSHKTVTRQSIDSQAESHLSQVTLRFLRGPVACAQVPWRPTRIASVRTSSVQYLSRAQSSHANAHASAGVINHRRRHRGITNHQRQHPRLYPGTQSRHVFSVWIQVCMQ